MPSFNKNFLKFLGGFVGIIAVSLGIFFGFSFWQNYNDEKELRTLLKGVESKQQQNQAQEKSGILSPTEDLGE